MPTFEIVNGVDAKYHWRLRSRDGGVIAVSVDGYASKAAAHNGVDAVKIFAPTADIADLT